MRSGPVINTPTELNAAETRWKSGPGDPTHFDDAVDALDSAICQADVRNALKHDPVFAVRIHSNQTLVQSQQFVGDILANQALIVRYTLTEYSTYADVEIHP